MIRKLVLLLAYICVPLSVAGATFLLLQHLMLQPADPSNSTPMVFEVADQAGFKQVSRDLQNKGLIRRAWILNLLAQFKHKDTSIMAGEYELNPSMTPEQILDKMVSGKMVLRRVTIKEGASIWDIGPLIEEAGILPRAEFDAALTDPTILKELGVPANSFEGYLFPETYQFPRNTKPKKILATMLEQLDTVWKPEWNTRLQIMNLSKHQILTLASIVEKESGNKEEQPRIAAVFANRLKRGMRLQADPTVIYGIPNFNGNLTKEDLTTPTPYNTYVIDGLPPGPIANPGKTALEATLFPAQTDDIYFVGNGQGKHVFSETLTDHNEAVNEFQRGGVKVESKPQKNKK